MLRIWFPRTSRESWTILNIAILLNWNKSWEHLYWNSQNGVQKGEGKNSDPEKRIIDLLIPKKSWSWILKESLQRKRKRGKAKGREEGGNQGKARETLSKKKKKKHNQRKILPIRKKCIRNNNWNVVSRNPPLLPHSPPHFFFSLPSKEKNEILKENLGENKSRSLWILLNYCESYVQVKNWYFTSRSIISLVWVFFFICSITIVIIIIVVIVTCFYDEIWSVKRVTDWTIPVRSWQKSWKE